MSTKTATRVAGRRAGGRARLGLVAGLAWLLGVGATSAQVSKTYCISGTSDGGGWTYDIRSSLGSEPGSIGAADVPGLGAGGSAEDLAEYFGGYLAERFLFGKGWSVTWEGPCVTITGPRDFTLFVGTSASSLTPVGATPVPFNPVIQLVSVVNLAPVRLAIEGALARGDCLPSVYLPAYLEVVGPTTPLGGHLELAFDVVQDVIDAGRLVGCPDAADLDEAQCRLDAARALAAARPPLDIGSSCATLVEAFSRATCRFHGQGLRCPGTR